MARFYRLGWTQRGNSEFMGSHRGELNYKPYLPFLYNTALLKSKGQQILAHWQTNYLDMRYM